MDFIFNNFASITSIFVLIYLMCLLHVKGLNWDNRCLYETTHSLPLFREHENKHGG